MKIGYQGVAGAYSYIASKYLFPKDKLVGLTDFDGVFEALEKGSIDLAVLPIENTIVGSIYEIYDLIYKYKYWIKGEVTLKIDHNLLAVKGSEIDSIEKAYSHIKALGQCKEFFEENPHIDPISYEDTAVSAGYVSIKQDPRISAIASLHAAKIYNLEVLKSKIQTGNENYTRFIIISKTNGDVIGEKTSLLFSTTHEPGSLLACMQPFAEENLNLTYIESRPLINQAWKYMFYLDFEHDESRDIQKIINKMKSHTQFIRRLGTYPKGDLIKESLTNNGGLCRTRTCDLSHVKGTL